MAFQPLIIENIGMKNKKTLSLFLFIILLTTKVKMVVAQDYIYTKDNEVYSVKITHFNPTNIEYILDNSTSKTTRALSEIALVINDRGYIILPEELESENREIFINEYQNIKRISEKYDIILYKQPLESVRCNISYESNEIVNFKTIKSGDSQTENKKDLLFILYTNGKHSFFASPTSISLSTLKKKLLEKADISTATTHTTTTQIIKLSNAEMESYSKKAELKVDGFSSFLNLIANKELSSEEKDKVIEQATKLFTPGATIQVSFRKPDGTVSVATRKIEEYLKKLKLSKFSSVKIEWSDIQYIGDLKQEADGNYYGTITGEQRFSGYNKNGKISYSDIVKKDVKVMITTYNKTIDAVEKRQWEVFLGNIGIVENK
ncbi:hypothetical protein [Flectobacillus sp. BAB-3569]|uniref:hypothetical protein n=1 Tax=Flectobacillus sp. BAB-3569 TaxID=1509483 RepID=UPI000BD55C89|nr:hypothetical protein [Flectobacillus sp. BAB-3569]PAC28873.1 hypothetical protein BWI92_17730 [Flectobacillus sp. BAB-3569]